MTKHYKLRIAYDGTNYGGWQVQPNSTTIQQLIQEAMAIILRHPTFVTGSGRTDAGVHALGQIAHFSTDNPINPIKLLGSLNGLLPKDIRIMEITETTPDFHARYSAIGKTYRYHATLGPVANPFTRLYSWHLREKFSKEQAQRAAHYFIGTHDFCSFANNAHHDDDKERSTIRTIYRIDTIETPHDLYWEFEGNGFLYKMVRNMVGAIVEAALGQIDPDDIPKMLKSHDRRTACRAAPPHGLFLVQVKYP